ncbi:hypothetical protein [Streptomyces fagopyri]|uniref:hypothetical protein n=1 Tax=Streptomyces fagopyri TaxID=2662397 RepID=UPI003F4CF193
MGHPATTDLMGRRLTGENIISWRDPKSRRMTYTGMHQSGEVTFCGDDLDRLRE